MAWKEVGEAVRFDFKEKGDQLTGKLIDIKQTKEYDSKVYTILDAEGDSFYFFGCYKLDSVLPALQGRFLQIIYKGKAKIKKGQTIREFDVKIWSDDEGATPEGFDDDVPF